MYLSDDDPEWDRHSGGSGHAGLEWASGDEDRALAYWDALDDKARAVLQYLFSRRGHQIHNGELVRELGLDPEGTKNPPNVISGALNRVGEANRATGHRYPFRWWERDGGADYAVRTSTAGIFERALFAAQTQQGRGDVLAFKLSTDQMQPFIGRLVDTMDDTDVRIVLGSACTTAARAVQQFVAALQLPYNAAGGWREFLDHLGERPASLRECVVVTDACQMLKHEDADLWHEAVKSLHGGPHHLGGGWSTLVLADDAFAWDTWVFNATDIRPRP
ncbi:DUF6416 domain-containing protein [Spirillospora sp. NPDC048819]|uniref:DUF6416 domain-containing protein n=1 Tax=Spirillospora sp. NPDC048819 TaxID=3155268 RepID=UPI0034107E6C